MRKEISVNDFMLSGYTPGVIGRVTELHATYYKEHWNFDLFFESKVATELSEFLNRFDAARDGFWVATLKDTFVGSIAIDGCKGKTEGARLRWFIVAPEYQGCGLGQRLLQEAVSFCRKAHFRRIHLSTFAGLDAARHLYEKFGFALCEEKENNHWGKTVREQIFELTL